MRIISSESRVGFQDCRDTATPCPYANEMNTLKTILYIGSTHGFFTFYLPYQLALFDHRLFDLGVFRYLALPFWIIGTLVIFWCSLDIIRKGRGTPAHFDPPKTLIINGLYRHVRNPIYLGALLVQLGHILWFGSEVVISYFLFFVLTYHILIVFVEEPILRNEFGVTYEEYTKNVPRWIPRLRKI
jgi:protein-S-isoprenylcysteine O-methyltransferase Ste14